jgi:hypothetical protein
LLLRPVAGAAEASVGEPGEEEIEIREDLDRVSELRIQLQRVESLEDLGYVQPGEELVLAVGDRLRLSLVAVLGERRRAPVPVRAELSVEAIAPRKEVLRVESVDSEEGTAVVTALRPTNGGERRARLRYRVLDELNMREGLVSGSVPVRVISPRP